MGFVTGTIRLLYLKLIRNDLEYKIMKNTEARRDLSEQVNAMLDIGTNLDPNNPAVQSFRARREKLENMEKALDAKLTKLQTKLQAVEEEIKSATDVVQKNISSEFSYSLGGGR